MPEGYCSEKSIAGDDPKQSLAACDNPLPILSVLAFPGLAATLAITKTQAVVNSHQIINEPGRNQICTNFTSPTRTTRPGH